MGDRSNSEQIRLVSKVSKRSYSMVSLYSVMTYKQQVRCEWESAVYVRKTTNRLSNSSGNCCLISNLLKRTEFEFHIFITRISKLTNKFNQYNFYSHILSKAKSLTRK